jgi:hypothetical protein
LQIAIRFSSIFHHNILIMITCRISEPKDYHDMYVLVVSLQTYIENSKTLFQANRYSINIKIQCDHTTNMFVIGLGMYSMVTFL